MRKHTAPRPSRIVGMVIPTIRTLPVQIRGFSIGWGLARYYLWGLCCLWYYLVTHFEGVLMDAVKRVSVTLPPALVADLDAVASRLGISRSAFLSALLPDVIAEIRTVLDLLPPSDSPDDVRRFRGASADYVQARVDGLRDLLGGSDA